MKLVSTILLFAVTADCSRAVIFTNSDDADTFVRSNSPAANYGGAGALSVSGNTATNTSSVAMGIADTFLRFNTAAMVASFNLLFGAGNWVVSSAKLQVTEVAVPNNLIFDRGVGRFNIFWIADDTWTEGTGTPMAPTTDGIAFNDETTLLTNTVNLGVFTNTGLNFTNLFSLALPAAFTSDLSAGGEVGFYLTAIDPQTGMTFNSRSFGTTAARPFLEISAAPKPGVTSISVSGTNVVFSATNGATGGTYYILASTNVSLPLSQWTIVATNVLSANGNFSITATNAANGSQQFFILQTQ